MKLLIVSENPARRSWVSMSLGPDWSMSEALHGLHAVRMVEDEDFDLVICDETTEPFGAFGLSRELKVLIDPPAVIVLLERAQDVWLARWSGADRWFVAPYDPFALAEASVELVKARTG
jgi:DNA-binding response OmpR family regulator